MNSTVTQTRGANVNDGSDDVLDHPALADRPKITNQYFHLIRALRGALEPAITALNMAPGTRVLDYGCSTMRYKGLFPKGVDYIGADLPGNPDADIDLEENGTLPLSDDDFEAVFSTQVLEHVEDPDLYLAECRRVLKPGGELLLTTHGTFVFHPCPYDYWRWTHMGLQRTLEKAGFVVTSVEGVCGGLPTALQLLQDVVSHKLPRFLRPVLHALIQPLMALTDRLYKPDQKIRNATFFLVKAQRLAD